jgi:hypothetical protein
MELIERARHTLNTIANAALATTSADGTPWNSAVYIACDEAPTFFWCSQNTAIHSRNLAANPQVFLLVFDSTEPDQSGQAVYISGIARELQDVSAIKHALDCLAARRGERPKSAADFMGSHPRRVYAMVPDMMWTNVVKNKDGHYFDERVAIELTVATR